MAKIPVLLFEEHNEAFFVWHYAIQKNLLPKSGNILLHIDEHSDMGVPRFNHSLNSLNGNLQDLYHFTYNELTIENFIIPAIYQGLFNKLYWFRQSREVPLPPSMCVYSYDKEGKNLTAKSLQELGIQALFNPSYKKAEFQCLTVDEGDNFPEHQSVVLDIDLDYFSCNNKYYNFKGELEITEKQYHLFRQDPYQFMRLTLGSGVKTKVERGKYYLVFNEFSQADDKKIPNSLKVSEAEIIQRIERLVEFLQVKQVEIKLIDICRSRLSGFTPEDQYQFIEDNLIERLSKPYDLEVISLSTIYQQEKVAV
jgi:predicted XRE-type DNA-binding protein